MTTARAMRIIGVWQMAGGIFAAVSFLDAVRLLPRHQPTLVVLVIVAIGLSLGTAAAGYGLFRRKPGALAPSLVAQGLQLVGFGIGTWSYQLTLGPYVYLTMIWGQRFGLETGFMPRFTLYWATPGVPAGAAVNLLACWCFWKVLWAEPHELIEVPRAPAPAVVSESPEVAG